MIPALDFKDDLGVINFPIESLYQAFKERFMYLQMDILTLEQELPMLLNCKNMRLLKCVATYST